MAIRSRGSARSKVVQAIVAELKKIDGERPYNINLFGNVKSRLVFFDEVEDFPTACVVAGGEFRDYLPGGFKWGILSISIKLYVKEENPLESLELGLEDIEYFVDNNLDLEYDNNKSITDIRITSITTDEGVMAPLGIGEIILQVRYDL